MPKIIVFGQVKVHAPIQEWFQKQKQMEEQIHRWFDTYGVKWTECEGLTIATIPDYGTLQGPRGYGDHSTILSFNRPDGEDAGFYLEMEVDPTNASETWVTLEASEMNVEDPDDNDLAAIPDAFTLEQAMEYACLAYPDYIDDPAFTTHQKARRFQLVDATKVSGWFSDRAEKLVLLEKRWNIRPPDADPKEYYFTYKQEYYHWDLGLQIRDRL